MAVQRLRLRDLLISRLPNVLGLCASDTSRIAEAVNAAQERLLTCSEVGDEGWYGGYAEMVFNVSRNSPYLTLPRGVARLISLNACNTPIPIRNQFYEYLEFGDGHWPKLTCQSVPGSICINGRFSALRRSLAATFSDIAPPRKGIRVYTTEPADVGASRVFTGGYDANGQRIVTLDGPTRVEGVYAALSSPFVDVMLPLTSVALEISAIDTVLKDETTGFVSFYEVDLDTGALRLLLTMEPSETSAGYSRYYLNDLPQGCCNTPNASDSSLVELLAMVKLDLVPAAVDSDALLIQSKEAIIAECESARFADIDSPAAKQQSIERHRAAVRFLRGQQRHLEGEQHTAVNFAPFGSARLVNQNIGGLM